MSEDNKVDFEEKYKRLHGMLIEEVGEERVNKIMGYIDMSEEEDNTAAIREILAGRQMVEALAFQLKVKPNQVRLGKNIRRMVVIHDIEGDYETLFYVERTPEDEYFIRISSELFHIPKPRNA